MSGLLALIVNSNRDLVRIALIVGTVALANAMAIFKRRRVLSTAVAHSVVKHSALPGDAYLIAVMLSHWPLHMIPLPAAAGHKVVENVVGAADGRPCSLECTWKCPADSHQTSCWNRPEEVLHTGK